MKLYKLITISFVALAMLASCDKHDSMDDAVIVGSKAPQVYWDLGSSTVTAGAEVPFTAQYYTTNEKSEIDHLEVWYNIIQKETRTIACPLVKTFTYNISSSNEKEIRITQFINEYAHTEDNWNDSIRAYNLIDNFPTSNTLSSISWIKPETYDQKRVDDYFDKAQIEQFKDSLFYMMKYDDFENMMLKLGYVTQMDKYKKSTFDENKNDYIYHFELDTISNTELAEKTKSYEWREYAKVGEDSTVIENMPDSVFWGYRDVTFEQLTLSSSYHAIEFTRAYQLNANLRCYDKNGVYGSAIEKTIDLN